MEVITKRRNHKFFAPGTYAAQFVGLVKYDRNGQEYIRPKFLVYDDSNKEYENIASNAEFTSLEELDLFADTSPEWLCHAGFTVSVGLTAWGKATVLDWKRNPGFVVPVWARKTQDEWQGQEGRGEYYKRRMGRDKRFETMEKIRKVTREVMKGERDTVKYLGTDTAGLRAHLEAQFKPGMTWSNYGKWQIDHRSPLSRARSREDFITVMHYSNLQPLWAEENIAKYNKVVPN